MRNTKLFIVQGCHSCPNIQSTRTPNAGYADDYYCGLTKSKVADYVEWEYEKRPDGDFPINCPLPDGPKAEGPRAAFLRALADTAVEGRVSIPYVLPSGVAVMLHVGQGDTIDAERSFTLRDGSVVTAKLTKDYLPYCNDRVPL